MIHKPQGLRYSWGKPRYDLIPPEFLEALAEHYRKGAEKYTLDLGENPSEEVLQQYEGREDSGWQSTLVSQEIGP